jgi:hypothetical protein
MKKERLDAFRHPQYVTHLETQSVRLCNVSSVLALKSYPSSFPHMRLSPLFFIPLLALSGCTQVPSSDENIASSSVSSSYQEPLPIGNFTEAGDDTSGSAYVRGYAVISNEPEPFCERNCRMYDLVSFRVLETKDKGLMQYLSKMGQTDPTQYAITLGCTEGKTIRYVNQSGTEIKEYALDASATDAIIGATEKNPVTLFITKESIAGGQGAPACYSHFTTVTVVLPDNMNSRPAISGNCQIGGCSGEVCGEDTGEPIASHCIFKPEFACYQKAECKKQADGRCGWTQTSQLTTCLQNAQNGN